MASAPRWFWSRALKVMPCWPSASATFTGQPRSGHIKGLRLFIDDRSAGDTERIDIAAAKCRSCNRATERTAPQLPSCRGIERLHLIAFGCCNKDARSGVAEVERLRIEMTIEPGLEARVYVDAARALRRETRHHEISAAVESAMVGENGIDRTAGTCGREHERGD